MWPRGVCRSRTPPGADRQICTVDGLQLPDAARLSDGTEAATHISMTRSQWQRVGVALVAGAAGAALDLMPLPAVSHLWLGRAATLPIAIFYGPWHGALASLV